MKVIRYNRGYTIRVTDTEMDILRMATSIALHPSLKGILKTHERKSLARRLRGGKILRTDEDRRKDPCD